MINLIEYISEDAKRFPNKVAFVDDDCSVTYSQLDELTSIMAANIQERINNQINRPIVVLLKKNVKALIAFFAVLKSGNFYVCIDADAPIERTKKIIENLSPIGIICESADEFEDVNYAILDYADLSVNIFFELPLNYSKIIDTDPAYVLYTSGSTGVPKGTVISHRSVMAYIDSVSSIFGFDETTIFGSQTPFYFSMSVLDIYSTIRNAATLIIIPSKFFSYPVKLLQFIADNQINTIYWVPSAMCIVANWNAFKSVKVDCLKKVLFAGEVMPTKQLNVWIKNMPDALFANLFGPTEITDIGLYYIVNRQLEDSEAVPIGGKCSNSDAFAINDSGELVGTNEPGELYFRGSFVGLGYYNAWEKTREVFVQNPLNTLYPEIVYKTGDIVKINSNGEYIYLGRKDNQIKHMGYRIELGEIENIISAYEDVERCACIYNGENDTIVCFLQGNKINVEIIKSSIVDQLPQYMRPNIYNVVERLPLNQNGKVDRLKLKEIK